MERVRATKPLKVLVAIEAMDKYKNIPINYDMCRTKWQNLLYLTKIR